MPSINMIKELSDDDLRTLVEQCNQFKQAVKDHSREKRNVQRRCYSYFMSELQDGDLLPEPKFAEGGEYNAEAEGGTQRPQVFLPVTRSTAKMLYAQLKMALFPNDTDFFRVFGKTAEAAQLENDLTTAFKWLFKQSNLSEKLSENLINVIWSGFCATVPTVDTQQVAEWSVVNGQYQMANVTLEPSLCVDVCNPLDFYPDPVAKDINKARWVYCQQKSYQDMLDKPDMYSKLEEIESLVTNRGSERSVKMEQEYNLSAANRLQQDFNDTDDRVDYDLYYFPVLPKIKMKNGQPYRNMLVGVVADQVVTRFYPNLYPMGLNPAVYGNWMPDIASPYGTGPVEDIMPLQRLINFIFNHSIETMARSGNLLAVNKQVDISQIGRAGGLLRTEGRPSEDVQLLNTEDTEMNTLFTAMGLIKAEAQTLAGSTHPYMGMANQDTQKTATEFSIIQDTVISVLKEVTQHIAETFMQPVLERFMYLAAEYFGDTPVQIRIDEAEQTQILEVNLSVLSKIKDPNNPKAVGRGDFTMEMTSVNLAESKLAESNSLKELLQLMMGSPEIGAMAKNGMYPLLQRLAKLNNINDFDKFMMTPAEQNANMNGQLVQVLMQTAQGLASVENPQAQGAAEQIMQLTQVLAQRGALRDQPA
jgi:hypothetical protein